MSYPEIQRFDFSRNGHANRREHDATPRVLFVGMDFIDHELLFHLAGDEYVRTAHVFDAARDPELVAGLPPDAALRLGQEFERARWMQRRGL